MFSMPIKLFEMKVRTGVGERFKEKGETDSLFPTSWYIWLGPERGSGCKDGDRDRGRGSGRAIEGVGRERDYLFFWVYLAGP
jgi:hypothetical protein